MGEGNHQEQDWHPRMDSAVPTRDPGGRAFPVWIWGCGGGCLLVFVAVVGSFVWLASKLQSMIGPEAAWPAVAEVLPYGPEPPEGYMAMMFSVEALSDFLRAIPFVSEDEIAALELPIDRVITLHRVEGQGVDTDLSAMIYVFPVGTPEERRDEILHEEATELTAGGQETEPLRQVELSFQGRTVEATRFAGIQEVKRALRETDAPLEVLEIDLSEGRAQPVVLQLTGLTAPTEQDLEVFFEPFDVWGGR